MVLWRSLGSFALCHHSVFAQLSVSPVFIDTKQPHAPLNEMFRPKGSNILKILVGRKPKWFNVSDSGPHL